MAAPSVYTQLRRSRLSLLALESQKPGRMRQTSISIVRSTMFSIAWRPYWRSTDCVWCRGSWIAKRPRDLAIIFSS